MATADGDRGFLLGFIAGAVLGTAGAMLFAPRRGAETRRGLADGFRGLGQAARETWSDVSAAASAAVDKGREEYDKTVREARNSNARSIYTRDSLVPDGAGPRPAPVAANFWVENA
jgi:gas vesicle protein